MPHDSTLTWSQVQLRRLRELNADPELLAAQFATTDQRDRAYQKAETVLVKQARQGLDSLRTERLRPRLAMLQDRLCRTLKDQGFVQVSTPILMSRGLLAKMTIVDAHPLYEQVFWVDAKRCL